MSINFNSQEMREGLAKNEAMMIQFARVLYRTPRFRDELYDAIAGYAQQDNKAMRNMPEGQSGDDYFNWIGDCSALLAYFALLNLMVAEAIHTENAALHRSAKGDDKFAAALLATMPGLMGMTAAERRSHDQYCLKILSCMCNEDPTGKKFCEFFRDVSFFSGENGPALHIDDFEKKFRESVFNDPAIFSYVVRIAFSQICHAAQDFLKSRIAGNN